MQKTKQLFAALMAALLLAALLAGCGKHDTARTPATPAPTPAATPAPEVDEPAPAPDEDEPTPETEEDEEAPETDQDGEDGETEEEEQDARDSGDEDEPVPYTQEEFEAMCDEVREEHPEYSDAAIEGYAKYRLTKGKESEANKPAFGSLEAIAALGGKQATVEKEESKCVVQIFDDELNHGNPYDVTWDYGKEYDKYVDAADWSLIFDAAYYKKQFPLLAMQYHDDDALLLKHFQTVGIHEGRQASRSFNVAAYKDNCAKSLRDAFGDNYECYVLYYLLHQDTETKITVTGNYPKILTQKMTAFQKKELENVNKYRAEVGADPLEFDTDLAAFASYRGYVDCTEGWDDHDYYNKLAKDGTLDKVCTYANVDKITENKDTMGLAKAAYAHTWDCARDYRYSPSHYEAMIRDYYDLIGPGNFFVSDKNYNWGGDGVNVIEFDVMAKSE